MPKRIAPLSEDSIKSAKISDKAYKLFDGGGLYFLVTPDGGKRWRFKYRFDEKEKSLSCGAYPAIRLDEARISRDEAREILSMGIDPATVLKQMKKQEKPGAWKSKAPLPLVLALTEISRSGRAVV